LLHAELYEPDFFAIAESLDQNVACSGFDVHFTTMKITIAPTG
jgi:hypothetical protein